jgi:hypothetical protein
MSQFNFRIALLTGYALNVAIGLQVVISALITGLSAVTTGRNVSYRDFKFLVSRKFTAYSLRRLITLAPIDVNNDIGIRSASDLRSTH